MSSQTDFLKIRPANFSYRIQKSLRPLHEEQINKGTSNNWIIQLKNSKNEIRKETGK